MSYQSSYHQAESFQFGGITWAVQRILLINTAIFALQLLVEIPLGNRLPVLVGQGAPGGWPLEWLMFDAARPWALWTYPSYMFLHANLSHLFFNMLGLFIFGPEVERTVGSRQFVQLYMLSGMIGVLGELLVAPFAGFHYVVGASGAVMGVLIAFAMVAPNQVLYLFPIPFPITARGIATIYIFMNILSAMGLRGSQESWATHFGGMAVGYGFMKAIPMIRRWELERDRRRIAKPPKKKREKKDPNLDRVGEAVDNIFKFEDRDRRK